MSAATVWRTCPACGSAFEQPDDPGRKRVYCSRACQQAAYRTRQRTSAGQRQSSGQHTGRQDGAGQWRREREGRDEQRRQRTGQQRPGAGQRQHQRQDGQQPPPGSANGHRPGATTSDQRARFRRIIEALLRKAASTPYPHEAEACRAKAEALRRKYGL